MGKNEKYRVYMSVDGKYKSVIDRGSLPGTGGEAVPLTPELRYMFISSYAGELAETAGIRDFITRSTRYQMMFASPYNAVCYRTLGRSAYALFTNVCGGQVVSERWFGTVDAAIVRCFSGAYAGLENPRGTFSVSPELVSGGKPAYMFRERSTVETDSGWRICSESSTGLTGNNYVTCTADEFAASYPELQTYIALPAGTFIEIPIID